MARVGEVGELREQLAAKDTEIADLRKDLTGVMGVIQQYQPEGSPIPGGPEVLTRWVLDTFRKELGNVCRERADAWESAQSAKQEVDRLREALTGLHDRLSGWEVRECPRDTFQPRRCSVEKGTGLALRVIARDFNFEQAEAVEAFIFEARRIARAALAEGGDK